MSTNTETIDLLKKAQSADLSKAWTQSSNAISGITNYDLEEGAKSLFPVITPLRNLLPRVNGNGGIQANWRAVTGINTSNLSAGVSQGNRGGVITSTTQDFLAVYKTIGLEDYVTWEAELAAEGFDDLRARAALNLLRATMIQEEAIILGGNSTLALGATPTPTLATSTTGGSLPATTTYSVICVMLSLAGFQASSLANGVPGMVTRTNADGSSDTYGGGSAQKSTSATIATGAGSTNVITASVAVTQGAYAYAWYFGVAGSERLYSITTINSVVITSVPTTTQLASALAASDSSTNSLVYDGLLTLASKSGSGSYFASQATGTAGTGTGLTADNAGNILEIDTALKWFWDNLRLSPTAIYVNSQEQVNIQKKILSATTSSPGAQRFMFQADQRGLTGGVIVRSYLNKFTMSGDMELPIQLHPNMPAGTIMFVTSELPYPLSNVTNVMQIRTRRDYYQLEWPARTRKYELGVYADEVLQHYFPPSLGIITNIGNN